MAEINIIFAGDAVRQIHRLQDAFNSASEQQVIIDALALLDKAREAKELGHKIGIVAENSTLSGTTRRVICTFNIGH